MRHDKMVELYDFLKVLSKNISLAIRKRVILPEFLNTTEWNYQSVLHSRVWGIIAKTGFDLGYVVEIGAGFKPASRRQFRPDVQLWKSDKLIFLVEYESTNSSDLRILWRDLRCYVDSMTNPKDKYFPLYWLIIYTLPDSPVTLWKSWDYEKSEPMYTLMTANPHQHYKQLFKEPSRLGSSEPSVMEYTENSSWNDRKIFLINLSSTGLEIDFPERLSKRFSFE